MSSLKHSTTSRWRSQSPSQFHKRYILLLRADRFGLILTFSPFHLLKKTFQKKKCCQILPCHRCLTPQEIENLRYRLLTINSAQNNLVGCSFACGSCMFPSTSLFDEIDCPLFRWGRCKRPYCVYNHGNDNSSGVMTSTGMIHILN